MRQTIAALALTCFSGIATAADYYVSPKGDDAGSGSATQPWATVQRAMSDSVSPQVAPGDTVFLRKGVYREQVAVEISGSTGSPITLRNAPDERAVLGKIPGDVEAVLPLLSIDGQSDLVIEGLEFGPYATRIPNETPIAILVTGEAHDVVIRGNKIKRIQSKASVDEDLLGRDAHGILVAGTGEGEAGAIHDLTIENNEISHLKLGSSEALAINGNVRDFLIKGNRVHHCDNIGIVLIGGEGTSPLGPDFARSGQVHENTVYKIASARNPAYEGPAAGGIYVDGADDIEIARNLVYRTDIGIEIGAEHNGVIAESNAVLNNIVHSSKVGGIFLGGFEAGLGGVLDTTVIHNTLYRNDRKKDGNGEIYFQYNVTDSIVANNILIANSQGLLIGQVQDAAHNNSGNQLVRNLYFTKSGEDVGEWQFEGANHLGFAVWQAAAIEPDALFADPIVVKKTQFHLAPESPAIDQAAATHTLPEDFDGDARPQGVASDIGADEVN